MKGVVYLMKNIHSFFLITFHAYAGHAFITTLSVFIYMSIRFIVSQIFVPLTISFKKKLYRFMC